MARVLCVDRLVGIADDCEVARLADPQLQQALLERVGVLVLVDADPGLLGLDGPGGGGVRFEQLDRQREHVLEVDPPVALLLALVVGVDAREEVGRDGRPIWCFLLPLVGRDAADLARLLFLPVPAPARMTSGPLVTWAAAR